MEGIVSAVTGVATIPVILAELAAEFTRTFRRQRSAADRR